jgi:hypothetical protein
MKFILIALIAAGFIGSTTAIWHHHYRTNLVQIASLLRADLIFGKNRGLSYGHRRLLRAPLAATPTPRPRVS